MSDWDWRKPDYDGEFRRRLAALQRMRDKGTAQKLCEYYADQPVAFIDDWGCTFDPRNAEIGLPTTVPFVLFDRQAEFVDWVVDRWRRREDGLVEKSRDMGVSWLCVGISVWMWRFHPGVVVGFGSRKEEYVDSINDPKSLFWKIRHFIEWLPGEFKPHGWSTKCAPFMRIQNPENGAVIVGEAGDNIGRGNRASIYFKDESAFYEHPDLIDAALSQTSNCKIDVSTPNGSGNPFYRKRHGGRVPVFVFDWKEDPRKDQAWYDKQVAVLDPHIVAQEIDRNYEASVVNALLSGDVVRAAAARGPADVRPRGGLRVGVDVARFGNDKTVISFRRGRVLLRQVPLSGLDTVAVAGRCRAEIASYGEEPEQIAVDTIGIGAGVADMLRGWYPDRVDRSTGRTTKVVVDVNVSLKLDDGVDYNLRARMYRDLAEWLLTASIPNDQALITDLTALRYGYRLGERIMESKDDAKKRGVKSPDYADSLAVTFAIPAQPAPKKTKKLPAFVMSDSAMGALG